MQGRTESVYKQEIIGLLKDSAKDLQWIGVSVVLNAIISYITTFIDAPFWFNENQILYIFATVAQITGGLLGLTLAAYALIDDKFKKIGDNDESSFDYVNQIRNDNFANLISISVLSVGSILLSILVLSVYRYRYLEIVIFFMLESIGIFIQLLVKIFIFITNANPNNIAIEKEKEKEQFDAEYSTNTITEEQSLASFITNYNILEENIKNYARKQYSGKNDDIRLQFRDALNILKDLNIISQKSYVQINELRLYRNSLVHSIEEDKAVNPVLFRILKKISDLFSTLINSSEGDECEKAKEELEKYVSSLPENIDEELLYFLSEHPSVTIREIANALNITVASASRKLQKLIAYGYVKKQDKGKNIIYYATCPVRKISFDYSNNNGVYVIGNEEEKFSTQWSKGSDTMIHAYSDADDIEHIARISNVENIFSVSKEELFKLDYSSRCRDIRIGDIVVWKNIYGHYLLTCVKRIYDDTRGADKDFLECEYRIIL